MHASSLENMQRCYEEFLGFSGLLEQQKIRVLDIGSMDVNGSYRQIFSDPRFDYVGLDLEAGPGVDVVVEDPYTLPFDADSFDLVISGQAFEHAEFFWQLFAEMVRVTNSKGFLFLLAPSAGPIHRYPVDCYRFYPDSFHALAKFTHIHLAGCWMDDRGPWNDLVGVFTKRPWEKSENPRTELPINLFQQETSPAPVFEEDLNPEFEITRGQRPYLETIEQVHNILQPRLYLEIGIRRGHSLRLAQAAAIAVDPCPELDFELKSNQTLIQKTSDQFFREDADTLLEGQTLDLAFIDGMHLFEFALRDFINIERRAAGATVIIIDDIFPNHAIQASRQRCSRVWTGDVWKLYAILKEARPDLILLPVDAHPTGLLLVTGLNPQNRVLSARYNPLVAKYKNKELDAETAEYLERSEAMDPSDGKINLLLNAAVAEREQHVPGWRASLRRSLRG